MEDFVNSIKGLTNDDDSDGHYSDANGRRNRRGSLSSRFVWSSHPSEGYCWARCPGPAGVAER